MEKLNKSSSGLSKRYFSTSDFFSIGLLNYHHLLLKINVCRSRSGSNQPEALFIEHPSHIEPPVNAKGNKKVKPTKKKQVLGSKNARTTNVPLDGPSMGTRSKKTQPPSPTMSTRSKRRLSL